MIRKVDSEKEMGRLRVEMSRNSCQGRVRVVMEGVGVGEGVDMVGWGSVLVFWSVIVLGWVSRMNKSTESLIIHGIYTYFF